MNSQTKLFGLLGFPLTHSFSPQIHNYVFKKSKINAVYLCFEVKQEDFKGVVGSLTNLGVEGFNVTIPYKEKIISCLDEVSQEADVIGAVNTVKCENGKLVGYNTDGAGFILSLKQYNFSPQSKNVLILGAGGAAKAVGVYLAKEKAKLISIYDLECRRANDLGVRIKSTYKSEVVVLENKENICLKNVDLIVNATGVGLQVNDQAVISLEKAAKKTLVYDLIYNPTVPVFLKEAKKFKLKAINGLAMLVYQALKADSIWFNKDFSQYAAKLSSYLKAPL